MHQFNQTIRFIISIIFIWLTQITVGSAGTQTITPSQQQFTQVSTGDIVSFSLNYQADNPNLSGLGIDLLFDSSQLEFQGLSEVFSKGKLAQDTQVQPDKGNRDNNSKTDQKIGVAWLSLATKWPGTKALPLKLYQVSFKVKENFEATRIHLIGESAAGETFVAHDIQISGRQLKPTVTSTNIPTPVRKTAARPLSRQGESDKLGIIIPLFDYPFVDRSDSEWNKVIAAKQANPEIDIIVIANPSNGHFTKVDPFYTKAINKLVAANITVVGYVYTKYGARDSSIVKADIDNWTQFYKDLGVTGIFFDEAERKGQQVDYYSELTQYAKAQGYETTIINPGLTIDQSYIDRKVADIIVTYEDSYARWEQYFKSGYVGKNNETSDTSLSIMLFDAPTANMKDLVKQSQQDGFDYIYFTSGTKAWNSVGSYFNEEVLEALSYARDSGDANSDGNSNSNDSGNSNSENTTDGIIDRSIASGSDDIEQSETGKMSLSSSDLELVHEGDDQTIGLRFTDLNIPQGTVISEAYIQFTTDETEWTDSTLLNIYAQAADNALSFSSTDFNASSRTKTSASVAWDIPIWTILNESAEKQRTPDLSSIVQELVNRNNWQANNAMAFIIQGTGKRTADAYEGGVSKAPKLHIEYQSSDTSNTDGTDSTGTSGNTGTTGTDVDSGNPEQYISLQCRDKAAAGSEVNCSVWYDNRPNHVNLFGLGLKIHFNSQKLEWLNFSNVLPSGLLAQDLQAVIDNNDLDGNTSTDHYLNTAWSDIGQNWPNQALPIKLYDVQFRLKDNLALDEKISLRFSGKANNGYQLTTIPHTITVGKSFYWDIDSNAQTEPLTDGVLLLRYLFNFKGNTLTNGVLSNTAQRTSTEIETYLSDNRDDMDIDGDGEVKPLTDGLLLLRYLFDFRGESLIKAAISDNASRKTATEIEAYIENYLS